MRLPVVPAVKVPSISLISLGCAKNQVDSELILSSFLEQGFQMVEQPRGADVVVVNTCGFIGPAKEESIDTILDCISVKKERPAMKLMVSGCLYQRYPEIAEELKEVDYWLTEPGQVQMEKTVKQVMADMGVGDLRAPGEPEMYRRKVLLSEPGSAFLRISQGCSRTCAFCSIPLIKGPIHSKTIDQLVADVNWLTSRFGIKEINLVAQDLTSFGNDRKGNEFLQLLTELDKQTGVLWYRLHYVYPFGLTRQMLEFLAGSKRFARYIDMPFQHGDDEVLKKMRRGGTQRTYLDYIRQVREMIPDVALRTTILVGHPGEGEVQYENLLDFVREARFEWMGVFPFSTEDGTASGKMRGKVHKTVKERRAAEVMDVFREARTVDAFRLGEVHDALVVEDGPDEMLTCRTEKEAPDVDGVVYVPKKPGIRPGMVVKVRVDDAQDMDFIGEIVSESPRTAATPVLLSRSLPVAVS